MMQKRLVEKEFSSAKRIELELIESKNDLKAYRRILDYFHRYKNWTHIPARRIRWLVYADGEVVGVIGIASSPMNVGCRDKWIGWNKEQRMRNLQKIANNYRFCMMVRGLGSRVLPALYKEARRRRDNPPHWYFPISYAEMHKRRMANIDKALKKIGLKRKDLKGKYKHLEKNNKKNNRKKRRR